MANSDWVEADRVDRLKPLASWQFDAFVEIAKTLSPDTGVFVLRAELCDKQGITVAEISLYTPDYRTIKRIATSIEELVGHMNQCKMEVPQLITDLLGIERRLRVSE